MLIMSRPIPLLMALAMGWPSLHAQSDPLPLPPPTGPYPVGTRIAFMVDSTREETWTPDPNDRRSLLFQFWYPADSLSDKGGPAPYVPDYALLQDDLAAYWSEGGGSDRLGTMATRAALFRATAPGPFPMIVFSHGMNSARFFYTALLEELASHGYIVVAIDHSYWGPGVAFPDGRHIAYTDGMVARDQLGPLDIDALMQEGIGVMSDDQLFIVSQLKRSRFALRDQVDWDRLAVVGHSMGGMAATRSCLGYAIFSACASLDGATWTGEGFAALGQPPAPSEKPFLLLTAPLRGPADMSLMARRYESAWRKPVLAVIEGARHNSVTDLAFLDPKPLAQPALAPEPAFRVAAGFLRAFLDRHLKFDAAPLPSRAEITRLDQSGP